MASSDKDLMVPFRPRSAYTANRHFQDYKPYSFYDFEKYAEGGCGEPWLPIWKAPPARTLPFFARDNLESLITIGLLTGHTTLRAHLFNLGLTESKDCRICGEEPEDSIHIVGRCPGLAAKRHSLLGRAFLEPSDLPNLKAVDVLGRGGHNMSVTANGIICLRLRDRIKVEMMVDGAIRLTNPKNNIVMGLSTSGVTSGLIHPNGRTCHHRQRVEIQTHNQHGNTKFAKMWYKGVSFTAEQCVLVYLVDSAGTRTTTDTFLDLRHDFISDIFYSESRHGPSVVNEAIRLVNGAQYWLTNDAIENWVINNIRISQTNDGLVRIHRGGNKYQLRTSPSNGTASINSPDIHCTASLGQTRHLFIRYGDKRMHFDGRFFTVRNAGHSAGFDDKDKLKVY